MSSGIAGNAQSFNSYDSEATAVPLLTDEMGLKIAEFRVPHHMPYSGGASLASISVSNFHNTVDSPTQSKAFGDGTLNPSSSSTQMLLEDEVGHVQYATYRDGPINKSIMSPSNLESSDRGWIPIPLRSWFWIPLVLFLIAGAGGLETALYFSKKNQGWPARDNEAQSSVFHYIYIFPPVAIAAIVAAMWTWTDIEIKKMQPYVDLVHGDSPPHRSLLLDYTRTNNFVVWTRATANRHYLVALATLMVILTLSFQPLAAALLTVKDTWYQAPDVVVKNMAALGLNQNTQFNDLSSFLAAAGYAGATIMYGLGRPAFSNGPYTIAPFELPTAIAQNGTVFANTTAIKTDPGCQAVSVQMTNVSPGRWSNFVSYNDCSITWIVTNNSTVLFGADMPACANNPPIQFSPIIFWIFIYQPTVQASATLCFPTFSLWEVNVNVDLATKNLTKVTELRPFSQDHSPFASLSNNLTGPPLNGHAYNGVRFNLTAPDQYVLARQAAIQLQLPAAIYQAALANPIGLLESIASGVFSQLSGQVYGTYLALVAREVYFLPSVEPITVIVKTFRKRLFLSGTAVHLLATAMLLLAFFGTIVHLFHREDRRDLRLNHEPGTIASAVSIGAQTQVGNVLAGRQDERDISEALKNKKFRINPETMKIVMEGEEGYEYAKSPGFQEKRYSKQ